MSMRILVTNKFWYRRGGLERVMFDEIAWLEAAGHETAHFSTRHPENLPSPWSGYFAPYLELGALGSTTPRDRATAAGRMFWNAEAARRFARLLDDFRPDVVHLHGIHRQISPSILFEARRAGVPVVQSLHDHNLICASGDLLLAGARVCSPPHCTAANVLPCAVHRCVQQSVAKSALAAAELFWRRWLLRYETLVDAFISPSHYLAEAIARGGIHRRPIHVLPNAVPFLPASDGETPGEGFVYASRLSPEKGLLTLMRAVELAGVTLTVAGTGPLYESLVARNPQGVRFTGRVDGAEVDRLLAHCRAAVVPSECVENAPMAVLEAMRLGRPVIASRTGGIPEQVRDGVDGLLFTAGDELQLAAALRLLADEPALADRLGRAARDRVASLSSPETHLHALLDIYALALERHASTRSATTVRSGLSAK
jgi:glycosyltransferase involved in cell wall biosynthesis